MKIISSISLSCDTGQYFGGMGWDIEIEFDKV